MKTRWMKKLLTVTIVLAMTIGSTMTVFADDGNTETETPSTTTDSDNKEETGTGTSNCTCTANGCCNNATVSTDTDGNITVNCSCTNCPLANISCGSSDSSSSSSSNEESTPVVVEEYVPEPEPTYEEKKTQTVNTPISVAGVETTTNVAGVYAADTVRGCVVTTAEDTVKTELSLAEGQHARVTIYDTDEEKSSAAMVSVNGAIDAMGGGEMVASLYVDLWARQDVDGERIELADGSVGMSIGLPTSADTSKTYSIICVQPGGATTIYEDQDTNPDTVTFPVQAGIGTYAFVAQ